MQFLTKLLRREAVEPVDPVEMVSKAEYDRLEDRFNNVVAKAEDLDRIINDRDQTCRALGDYAAQYLKERDAARAEAEANKADAEELAQWRQYGQMRDPATGRLVPRVKAEVE